MKNSDVVNTISSGKYFAQIVYDEYRDSPREWDNLGTMVCFHRNYLLGDMDNKHRNHGKNELWFSNAEDFQEWVKENQKNIAVMLDLYLYDHSGISMSCSNRDYPFSDMWDSGLIGWIFVTKEDLRKEYSSKIVTAKMKKNALSCLKSEVETYDDYLTGNVYGYQIYRLDLDDDMELEDSDNPEDYGTEIESCYGFYGLDYVKAEAKSIIDGLDEQEKENCEAMNI